MTDDFLIRNGYQARTEPSYFHAGRTELTFQPDVYRDAARLAEAIGSKRIVDMGCGAARKLIPLADRFELVGVDFGANIEQCRQKHGDRATWIEADLDATGSQPVPPEYLEGSVVINADVIEHVRNPSVLVGTLREMLGTADALVISTPERDLTRTQLHHGPPPNPAHVREWNIREFSAMMRRAGFGNGSVGLTRAHDQSLAVHNILGVYTREVGDLDLAEEIFIDGPPPGQDEYAFLSRFKHSRPAAIAGLRNNWYRTKAKLKAEVLGRTR